jgi:hypothetical protein
MYSFWQKGLGYFLGGFLQTHLVTLLEGHWLCSRETRCVLGVATRSCTAAHRPATQRQKCLSWFMVGKLTMRYEQVGSQDAKATRVGKTKQSVTGCFVTAARLRQRKSRKRCQKCDRNVKRLSTYFFPNMYTHWQCILTLDHATAMDLKPLALQGSCTPRSELHPRVS